MSAPDHQDAAWNTTDGWSKDGYNVSSERLSEPPFREEKTYVGSHSSSNWLLLPEQSDSDLVDQSSCLEISERLSLLSICWNCRVNLLKIWVLFGNEFVFYPGFLSPNSVVFLRNLLQNRIWSVAKECTSCKNRISKKTAK